MPVQRFHDVFVFDHLARRPMYSACPRWLIDHLELRESSVVCDVGCGSGIFTEFVLGAFPGAPGPQVYAIDPSEHELDILHSRVDDERVTVLQGRAQDVRELVPPADAAVLCNVLHQIPLRERDAVCRGVFELLHPGGMFGTNTLFYDGGIPAETERFYTLWMMHARRAMREIGFEVSAPASTPVALQRLSPSAHVAMLERAGFSDVVVDELECEWTPDDWGALSRYSVFIQGALSVPDEMLEAGSRALIDGVRTAYDELGVSTIRRGWLQCAGRRV